LFVFDQERDRWFKWDNDAAEWNARGGSDEPVIEHIHFTGTGTRMLMPNAHNAITELFKRSF
jgi:hypothetical protein